ncbi:hypothetical protein VTL71DRAFT_6327 [Oculimacula yallundae]|uniref:2EXR domain-containing protein n=1 Tax=Oculimacula yallundae TaxID=86028 RepID=A0ABR4BXU3_9HELO
MGRLQKLLTSLPTLNTGPIVQQPTSNMSRLKNLLIRLPTLKTTCLPAPLTEFTLFGKLPLELRRIIIAFAAHEPREVLISYDPKFLARKHCETKLENHASVLTASQSIVKPYVYANFEVDRFKLLGLPHFESYDMERCNFTAEVLSKIKYLDHQAVGPQLHHWQCARFLGTLKHLASLQVLNIVVLGVRGDVCRYNRRRGFKQGNLEYLPKVIQASDLSKEVFDRFKSRFDEHSEYVHSLRNVRWDVRWISRAAMMDEDLYPTGEVVTWTQDTFVLHDHRTGRNLGPGERRLSHGQSK